MKGIILAGGKGKRLYPLTKSTQKAMIPICGKPLILYSLTKLVHAGIKDIAIIVGSKGADDIKNLIRDGSLYGARTTYLFAEGGVAKAIASAYNFANHEPICVMLSDNIIYDDIRPIIKAFQTGALVTYKKTKDTKDLTSFVIKKDNITAVIDSRMKPEHAGAWTPYAYAGIAIFDETVFSKIKTVLPSQRGEVEIIDLFNLYINTQGLYTRPLKKKWFDAGTFESLARAERYISNHPLLI